MNQHEPDEPLRPSPTDKVVNRHMARTLTELEDSDCPPQFIIIVRANLRSLRSDLNDLSNRESQCQKTNG